MAREPGYCHHKPSGQAYVRIKGRVHYLGAFGSEESKAKYRQLKAEFLQSPLSPKFSQSAKLSTSPTMSQVCLAYLEHAQEYYKGSREYGDLERAIRPIADLFAMLPADQFETTHFRSCQAWWLSDPGRSRQYINKQSKRLLRVIKWAVGEALMRSSAYEACRCVPSLKKGRSSAPEAEPTTPVGQDVVDATIPHLTQVLADMVRFQQLTGCRPGELVTITPSMVDRSSDVWEIRLQSHKTAHRGRERTIYVGPMAQSILSRYLLRAHDAPCFSPAESERQRRAARHAERVTPLNYGNRPGTNRVTALKEWEPGEAYTTASYGKAIKYACRKAFPAPEDLSGKEAIEAWHQSHAWSPNQLRHSAATAIRKKFGIEASQVILGHSDIGVTQVYAEKDREKAVEVARAIG